LLQLNNGNNSDVSIRLCDERSESVISIEFKSLKETISRSLLLLRKENYFITFRF